jgi:hypothetical protein
VSHKKRYIRNLKARRDLEGRREGREGVWIEGRM